MAVWRIVFTRRAEKAYEDLTQTIRERVARALQKLLPDPYAASGVKALKGREGYRLRVGDYRVLYDIEDEVLIVRVLDVANRREAYR